MQNTFTKEIHSKRKDGTKNRRVCGLGISETTIDIVVTTVTIEQEIKSQQIFGFTVNKIFMIIFFCNSYN